MKADEFKILKQRAGSILAFTVGCKIDIYALREVPDLFVVHHLAIRKMTSV